jgi:DNA-binding PadR family transcriptional regulator
MSRLSPDDVILGLLAAKPCHGYQLLEYFRTPADLGQVWHLNTSQLYSILKRLEQNNFVTGKKMESHTAPSRTEYQLTEAGSKHLYQWLNEQNPSASTRHIRTQFMSRLYIARLLDISTTAIIQQQIRTCQERRTDILTMRDQLRDGVGFLSLDLIISELETILQWIDRCHLALTEAEDN